MSIVQWVFKSWWLWPDWAVDLGAGDLSKQTEAKRRRRKKIAEHVRSYPKSSRRRR